MLAWINCSLVFIVLLCSQRVATLHWLRLAVFVITLIRSRDSRVLADFFTSNSTVYIINHCHLSPQIYGNFWHCSAPARASMKSCDWWACLSVCLSASISQKPHVRTSPIFPCVLPMAVARSSPGGVAIRDVLPVLWKIRKTRRKTSVDMRIFLQCGTGIYAHLGELPDSSVVWALYIFGDISSTQCIIREAFEKCWAHSLSASVVTLSVTRCR